MAYANDIEKAAMKKKFRITSCEYDPVMAKAYKRAYPYTRGPGNFFRQDMIFLN